MGDTTGVSWTDKTCNETRKPGPAPAPPRDGDKRQARHRINVEVRTGYRPHPNTLPCVDCGHVWAKGDRRHEYDHYLGYSPEHHLDVQAVCTKCHAQRDNKKANPSHCIHGHEYTAENTKFKPNGTRECLQCRRDREHRTRTASWWAARRARKRMGKADG